MQQPAQQPPVAMYVVHYVQPNQGQQGQLPQQMMSAVPQMQPPQQHVQPQMWGPYSQPVSYNGVPIQMVPYPQYMTLPQAQAMQAQVQSFPQSQPQPQPPGRATPMNAQPASAGQPASIPGPVQPLKPTSSSPGPPSSGNQATMAAAATLVKIQPGDSSLADFAAVASMQRATDDHKSGIKRRRDSEKKASKRGSSVGSLHEPSPSSAATNDVSPDSLSASADLSPSAKHSQAPVKKWRRYKRRNFPVEVEICLPHSKSKDDKEGSTESTALAADSGEITDGEVDGNGAAGEEANDPTDSTKVSPKEPGPPIPVIQFVPGLPETPQAVMNPIKVPELEVEAEAEAVGGATTKSPHEPLDEMDELDEEVMYMEGDDPTKRRKRSSNVFDEVLTMNPQYTPDGFVCPECYKIFKFRKHCRRHMVNHSGSKPFKCPKCPRSYTRKDTCQRHAAACRVKSTITEYTWDEVRGRVRVNDVASDSNDAGMVKEETEADAGGQDEFSEDEEVLQTPPENADGENTTSPQSLESLNAPDQAVSEHSETAPE